ncbi:MAG: mammalian cell entry protein [Actinobacteria bacterium 13_2_20CM_2_71_6]|nr:MAG: mammalian cell entry protein [Actinobacteria bacterium 13_2_20CM_2_71_6]
MRLRSGLLVGVLALGGCTLPGGAPGGPSYRVTAEFADVLDLVPQAAVKVNDVTVGSVEKLALSGWTARVSLRIDRNVTLPANATAAIRQTSLLGEKFVSLSEPADQVPQGRLADGATIPLARTSRTVEVEEVLAALGFLLNGGGLAQLKTINEELSRALAGREPAVRDTLGQLDTFLAGLDAQTADIQRAIDALDRFSAHLSEQRGTISAAIDSLDPGLTVLAQEREQLTGALTALSGLSTVGTRVVNASRESTLDSLRSLRPILDQLVRAGDNLPKALDFMLTYPFPPNVTGAISGNVVRLHLTLDLDGATILANLLTAPAPPAGTQAAQPLLPGLPALPGVTAPLPGPTPSGSPSSGGGSGGGGGGCGLLVILGCH